MTEYVELHAHSDYSLLDGASSPAALESIEPVGQRVEIRSDSEYVVRAAATHYLQRLLRHDPLNEADYRQLMRLYALNGNRGKALQTFEQLQADSEAGAWSVSEPRDSNYLRAPGCDTTQCCAATASDKSYSSVKHDKRNPLRLISK